MGKIILIICLSMAFLEPLEAHPVSFKGSKGIMGFHSPRQAHVQVNYSFQHWFALGFHHFERIGFDRFGNYLTANFLLKRWNGEASQGNLYLVAGGGAGNETGNRTWKSLSKLQFDIEDRNYYFLSKYSMLYGENFEFDSLVARAGIAPYVEDYDGFHTWIILEWERSKYFGEAVQYDLTPFIRMFYRNILIEIGQSFNGNMKLNYIAHF